MDYNNMDRDNRPQPELRNPRESWQSYIMNAPMRTRNALMDHAQRVPLSNIPANIAIGLLNAPGDVARASRSLMGQDINAPIDGVVVENSMTAATPLGPASALSMMARGAAPGAVAASNPFNNMLRALSDKLKRTKQRINQSQITDETGGAPMPKPIRNGPSSSDFEDARKLREYMNSEEFQRSSPSDSRPKTSISDDVNADLDDLRKKQSEAQKKRDEIYAEEVKARAEAEKQAKAEARKKKKNLRTKKARSGLGREVAKFLDAGGSLSGKPENIYHSLRAGGFARGYSKEQIKGFVRNKIGPHIEGYDEMTSKQKSKVHDKIRDYADKGFLSVSPLAFPADGDPKDRDDTPRAEKASEWLAGP